MLRHYYIIDSVDEVELLEHELQSYGIDKLQIHILTNDDPCLGHHHLYEVDNSLKRGLFNAGNVGATLGMIIAITILLVAYLFGWHSGSLGGMPIILSALLVLFFCTWEGDHVTVPLANINSQLFKQALETGKTVLFIDVEQQQELFINKIMRSHPMLKPEGIAATTPEWLLQQQKKLRGLLKS